LHFLLSGASKVGALLPVSLDRSVNECSLFSARMKLKLPLQQINVVVEKLTVSSKETFVQNDAIVVMVLKLFNSQSHN